MKVSFADLAPANPSKILGQGQFSRVVRVFHAPSRRFFALKTVLKADLEDDELVLLGQEIALHRTLSHPGIVRLLDASDAGDEVRVLYELAPNGCLFFYVDKNGMAPDLALRFAYRVALAVRHLHAQGVVHRDIKPENLVLDRHFNPQLLDFGCARRLAPRETRRSVCGTYEYMSPEVVREQGHDFKTDVWCLGVLLFELLHGKPPFADVVSMADLDQSFATKKIAFKSGLPAPVADLLGRMLDLNQFGRATIDEVLAHPAFDSVKNRIDDPLSFGEMSALRRTYAAGARTMTQLEDPADVMRDLQKYRSSSDEGGLAQALQRRSLSPASGSPINSPTGLKSPVTEGLGFTFAAPKLPTPPPVNITSPGSPILSPLYNGVAANLVQSVPFDAISPPASQVRVAAPPPVELTPPKMYHSQPLDLSQSNGAVRWGVPIETRILTAPGSHNRPSVTWVTHNDFQAPKALKTPPPAPAPPVTSLSHKVFAQPENSPPSPLPQTLPSSRPMQPASSPVILTPAISPLQNIPKLNSARIKELLREADSQPRLTPVETHQFFPTTPTLNPSPSLPPRPQPDSFAAALDSLRRDIRTPTAPVRVAASPPPQRSVERPAVERSLTPTFATFRDTYETPKPAIPSKPGFKANGWQPTNSNPTTAATPSSALTVVTGPSKPIYQNPSAARVMASPSTVSNADFTRRPVSPVPGSDRLEVRIKSRDRTSMMGRRYDEFSLRQMS